MERRRDVGKTEEERRNRRVDRVGGWGGGLGGRYIRGQGCEVPRGVEPSLDISHLHAALCGRFHRSMKQAVFRVGGRLSLTPRLGTRVGRGGEGSKVDTGRVREGKGRVTEFRGEEESKDGGRERREDMEGGEREREGWGRREGGERGRRRRGGREGGGGGRGRKERVGGKRGGE